MFSGLTARSMNLIQTHVKRKNESPTRQSSHCVSPDENPLQNQDLSTTVSAVDDLNHRVVRRLRDEMTRRKLSQRDVAGLLQWSQSRIAKLLTGRVELSVNDLAALCFAMDLLPTEAVRDHGLEFCAEMTPSELRFLERFRQLRPQSKEAMMTLFDVAMNTRPETRTARAGKKK